ncbi:hypothetical protein GCM10007938_25920 [Vibrio zhanjiangensis]|uniref:Uncharacterized protein n=1 Tax=Vibrio zhanjiangensis TaxID=1046128 RepID=A0ABQ6F1Q7_9VIBR|nr:hypothetical protein GCM10007938_25920 [Vibrio zhanjiangensis]
MHIDGGVRCPAGSKLSIPSHRTISNRHSINKIKQIVLAWLYLSLTIDIVFTTNEITNLLLPYVIFLGLKCLG